MSTYFDFEKVKRKFGRRTGGDRRFFSYAMVIPERRTGERRKTHRRQECLFKSSFE